VNRRRRAGFAVHAPRLAAMALAMVAAAASYAVHADRSASAQDEMVRPVAQPVGGSARHRTPRHARRKHRERRGSRRPVRLVRHEPVRTTVVVNRVVQRQCPRPAVAQPTRAGPDASDGTRAATETDREAERAVDGELQQVIDEHVPGR
jgi:hypothetical protein